MPSLIQSLVLVFSFYIQTQLSMVLDFLSNLNVNQQNGLQVLMTVWLEHHDCFQGLYAIKSRFYHF